MEFDTDRRGFLALAGTGTALSLAGCNAPQNSDGTPTGGTAGTSADGDAADRTATVAVTVDRQKLQQRRQEIRAELESGNISRTEAQKRFRRAQNELRSAAIASFTDRASNAGLSVEGTVRQYGVLLVSGSATALLDALSFEEVNALLSAATFQQAKSQAAQATGTPSTSSD